MKNSETPKNPAPYTNQDGTIQHDVYFGLTKKEHFALEIMKANIVAEGNNASIQSAADYIGISKDEYKGIKHWGIYLSKLSVDMANQLFDELERSDS